jgi:hypothetical protein
MRATIGWTRNSRNDPARIATTKIQRARECDAAGSDSETDAINLPLSDRA